MTAAQLERWLVRRIASASGLAEADVSPDVAFELLGLDSATAVTIAGELEEHLGHRVDETAMYDHPTIARLARALAGGDRETPAAMVSAGRSSTRPETSRREPVAIVGMGCRLPGADCPEAFWDLLREDRCAIADVPADRWDADALFDPDPAAPGRMTTRRGGFVSDIHRFDAQMFGIAPREAARLDPQQRMLLETAAQALDDAGLPVEGLAGTGTGVFIGISTQDWAHVELARGDPTDAYLATGAAPSVAANRLSYLLDLHGPSMAVDTACSSSLTAVHLACRSIWSGETDIALAGGVGALLSARAMAAYSKLVPLCEDALCKAFAEGANGVGRGEGAVVLVLRPLADALADGDAIHALVRGTAVGQDGRSNGLTAPTRTGQERVLRAALGDADVAPAELGLVEAHGTGTPLGDPIEAAALGAVLAEGRTVGDTCAVGSVKTNLGHLEAAAGAAGLAKAALALSHAEIPASLHFDAPNPRIPFDRLPIRVPTGLERWAAVDDRPRFAGVSAFGFGGTNAHVVLEEAPAGTGRVR
ncbi:MAG TPA: type I polyketide synthase [Thermoleophilaceae bacterium]|jgi:myxalamid-type polyketide synthase MxaE and MxaD